MKTYTITVDPLVIDDAVLATQLYYVRDCDHEHRHNGIYALTQFICDMRNLLARRIERLSDPEYVITRQEEHQIRHIIEVVIDAKRDMEAQLRSNK